MSTFKQDNETCHVIVTDLIHDVSGIDTSLRENNYTTIEQIREYT